VERCSVLLIRGHRLLSTWDFALPNADENLDGMEGGMNQHKQITMVTHFRECILACLVKVGEAVVVFEEIANLLWSD
jgi:hypothetical protein